MYRTLLFTVVAIGLFASSVSSAAPQLINYQGRLVDDSSNPVVDSSYSIVFTIYDASIAGTSV